MSINTPVASPAPGPQGTAGGEAPQTLPPFAPPDLVSLNCPLVASFVKAEGIKEAEQMKEFLQKGSGSPGTALHLITDNNPPGLQKKPADLQIKKELSPKCLRLNPPSLHCRQNKGVPSPAPAALTTFLTLPDIRSQPGPLPARH